jgi:S-DNA-T family DNA segregation ATPase FtsK/SpoIIIE
MLALLDTLKGVVRDFAAREEALNHEFRAKSNAELNAFEFKSRSLESKLAAHSAAAEVALEEEKKQREASFQRRKAAISRAHIAAKKRLGDEVNEQESRLNDRIRENSALAERQRDQALANAVVTFENFQQKLTGSGAALDQLGKVARNAFRGCGKFRRMLAPDRQWPEPDFSRNENQLFEELERLESKTRADLDRFQKLLAPRIFKYLPVWLVSLLLLGIAAAVPVLQRFGIHSIPSPAAVASLVALLCVWIFHWFGMRAVTPLATEIASSLGKSRRLLDGCFEKAGLHHESEQQRIKEEFAAAIRAVNQEWKQQTKGLVNLRTNRPGDVDEKARRLTQKNDEFRRAGLEHAARQQTDSIAQFRQEAAAQALQFAEAHNAKMAELKSHHQTQWQTLEADWKNAIEPLYATIRTTNAAAEELFPEWDAHRWEKWTPPSEFKNAAKFARLEVVLETFAEKLPKDSRLALPGPASFSVPMSLAYPLQGSIFFETGQMGGDEAVAAINNIIFRLLSTTPPGKASFTIFDPVGLGQNFAAIMHLADYEESSINSRIWTQTAQFEEKLAELNEHMEKVIQMYLRNEYATIAEYNAEAGTIAEKYHFLVIASFPVNFSDSAMRRLRNIAASGARCGVYTLMQWDQRAAIAEDLVVDELRKNSVCLTHTRNGFEFSGRADSGTRLVLDPPPAPEFATRFLHQAGQSSKDSARVEVPFDQVAPPDSDLWTENTTEELRVPIGRSGATKLQYLEVGRGTRQHALIVGKTGSGKSTLFHVIITNLALWCSPEQVEFYLVDFKKGVEFKCYASRRLPHAKVVAIESDRAFGLSVLQRVDEELRRRGDLFRKVGAQDLAGYKRAGGTEPMPRSLLIIDEFQEFFVEEDRVSQGAAVLLDRIVRQGRAFGIHVLLGSQTLGGAYTLARATIGQMVIRIALQCNEADAYLIMDQDNPAPRLLSRPGEGIYNDTAGSIEGNSPFQAVWLDDQERDTYLAKVRERADQNVDKYPGPIVFEGNAPAAIRENLLLRAAIQETPVAPPAQARVWLGAPNSIKGPTEAVFQKQSGSNLLIVGQSEERALTILSLSLVALAAQYPRDQARFIILDSTPPGFPQRKFFQRVIQAVPHKVIQVNNSNLAEIMTGLSEDLKRRSGADNALAPETFILIQGLQNFKKLKSEDDFSFSTSDAGAAPNPAAVLLDLISEGPGRGFHVIAACDTYNNVNRFLGRKTLSEFEMRVLFQMSASDSASLIDAPDAATLGFHRALFYHDRQGFTETFRPYAQPDNDWIEEVTPQLTHAAESTMRR